MKAPEPAVLLRIFIGESDHYQHKPLYEYIVLKARELGLAGATVIRGILGFGADSRLHSAKLLDLSIDLPIVVEIVDSEENIQKIMPFIDKAVEEGMVTLEKVKMIRYRKNKEDGR